MAYLISPIIRLITNNAVVITSCIDRVKFMLFSEVTPILEPKTKNELMFENQMYCNENPQDL